MEEKVEYQEPFFTAEEVKQHNSSDSAWMIYRDKVLDVTSFLEQHPGGEQVLLDVAGKDGTTAFLDVGHSKDAEAMMDEYVIGKIDNPDSPAVQKALKRRKCKEFGVRVFLPTAFVLLGLFIAYRYVKKMNA